MTCPARQQGYVLVTVMVAAFLVATLAFLMTQQSAISTNRAAADLEADEARYVAEAGVKHALWQVRQANCSNYANLTNEPFGDHSYSVTVTPTDGSPIALQSTGSHTAGARQVFSRAGIPIHDSSSPMAGTLIPGTEGKDTYIEGDPGHTAHNKGNDNELRTSSLTGKEYRALLQFDLSGLPPTATLQSATLELYMSSNTSADVVEAHRLLRDWTEGGVTWDTYDGANSWATPGGDYDPEITASFLADSIGPKSLDITDTAKAWVDGSLPNYGLILLSPPNSGGSTNKYHSADKTAEPWPRLTLTYVCECGAPCPGIIVGQNVILSTEGDAILGGLSFTDNDLAEYDRVADTATLFFEGAPLGLAQDIDALHVLANGHIVLSAINTINLGGITAENEDLIDYDPVANTATMLFDGSALFTSGSTDISAVHVMDNGHLLLANEYAATLGGLSFQPKDLIEYNPDANTATMLLDGSTVGLSGWINAVHRLDNGNLVLSANDTDTLGDLTFDKGDLVEYDPVSDSATLYMDGGLFAGDENIRSVHIGPGSGGGGNLLLVVGDDVSPTAQEAARRSLIESWGYAVNVIDVDDSQSAFDSAVAANDVVYISNAITEADLGSKLSAATIGIVNEAIDLNVVLGFSGSSADSSRDEIDIIDNSHSITSGFAPGLTKITNSLQRFTYFFTDTAPGQQVLAETNHLGPQYNTSFVTLETGAELWGGGNAAGRRVQLPWGEGTFDINALNTDGLTLLQRSIEWAGGAGASGGPIAHWKLDDGSGGTAVDSVGGHDGTLNNGPAWVAGQIGDALDFDGSNDLVSVPHQAIFTQAPMTVSAWFKLNTLPTTRSEHGTIVDKRHTVDPYASWTLYVNETLGDKIRFQIRDSSETGYWLDSAASAVTNTWYHVVGTIDASYNAKLYVNGALEPDEDNIGSLFSSNDEIRIGAGWSGGNRLDGVVDDVRFYDRALNAAEISGLYTAGAGGGLIAHWKLDETSGNTAVDSVGGNDGTLMNGPAWTTGKLDGGLSFDGSNDYIEVSSMNPMSYDDFTVSAWYKSAENGVDDDEYIFEHNDNFSYEITFGPTDDGTDDRLRFGFANGGSGTWDPHYGTSDVVDQQWHHVVGVREAGRIKLYVDGVLETDGPDAHAGVTVTIDGDGPFIGDLPGETERVHGTLDDVRLYDRALSATEIADLFAAGGGSGGGGGGGGGGCDGTFRDEFNSRVYSNSDGTLPWATDWQETGESTNPTGGDIRIDDDVSDYQLQVRDDGQTVWREADLSSAASATLSFDYRRQNLSGSNDYVAVEVSYNGGSSWTELARFTGTATDGSYSSVSYPLSAGSLSATTRIRFLTPGSGMSNSNMVWFDDVQIQCSP